MNVCESACVTITLFTLFLSYLTGMTSYDGVLFAAEQEVGAILTFDIRTGMFLGKIVKPGDPRITMIEQLLLSPC
jgi:hypothetical protein